MTFKSAETKVFTWCPFVLLTPVYSNPRSKADYDSIVKIPSGGGALLIPKRSPRRRTDFSRAATCSLICGVAASPIFMRSLQCITATSGPRAGRDR